MLAKYLTVFGVVFLAELGDKTQLATMLFASDQKASPYGVFLAASAALIVATAIGVLAGAVAGRYLEAIPLKLIAGIGFLLIGAWSIWDHFSGPA